MVTLAICLVAVVVCALTLVSGFGLGTLLMPVMALVFPLDVAIALTAVIHLLNNVLKFVLFYKFADYKAVLMFGIPALLAAFFGAKVFVGLGHLPVLMSYELAGRECEITTVKLVIGLLIMVFAVMDLKPKLFEFKVSARQLPIGGLLSGFFGGLSGHQGAFRSAFLIKFGLNKQAFVATGVVIACVVDISRLFVYSSEFRHHWIDHSQTLAWVTLAAFLGTVIGKKVIEKTTIESVQITVGLMLIVVGSAMAAGVV